MKTSAFVVVAFVATLAVCAGASYSAHSRALHMTSQALVDSCPTSSARNCALQHSSCSQGLPPDDQSGTCSCFQALGNCLHNAGCLNGTYEDLRMQYCITGDSYCCNNHGEFNGCGERVNFDDKGLCECEELYSGTFCNTTTATCSSNQNECGVCEACCKSYSQDTCDACVAYECDRNVCSDDSSCTACSKCCKSYLSSNQADCNLCVEIECGNSAGKLFYNA